jgi:hypothetical protein
MVVGISMLCSAISRAEGIAVTGRASTLGLGVEVTKSLVDFVNIRLGVNAFSYDRDDFGGDIEDIDVEYEVDLDLRSASAIVDLHPLRGGFRLSGGLLYNGSKIRVTAKAAESYFFGGHEYTPEEVGNVTGDLDTLELQPYLGLGWGNAVGKYKKVGLVFDLGVVYQGSPDLTLTADSLFATAQDFLLDLGEEEARLEDEMKNLKYYPIISLGISFKF